MRSWEKNHYSRVKSLGYFGLETKILDIECHQSVSLPSFQVVGMQSRAAFELSERVRSALLSCGARLPSKKITLNLSPRELHFHSEELDLAVAIACLAAEKKISQDKLNSIVIFGSLGLDGSIKKSKFANSLTHFLKKYDLKGAILPFESSFFLETEQLHFGGGFHHLREVMDFLLGKQKAQKCEASFTPTAKNTCVNYQQIKVPSQIKQAFLLAAAGSHHCLLQGPRGVGKSMLCEAFPGILPPLFEQERQEVSEIYDFAGLEPPPARPFRRPHSSVTSRALLGGVGKYVGELSLAHRGVLFLDEVLEIEKSTLESLRIPMELGEVHLAKANMQMVFPARAQILAVSNYCPCGEYGGRKKLCKCTPRDMHIYQKRISQALRDRMDICISLHGATDADQNTAPLAELSSQEMNIKATNARKRMLARQGKANAHLVGEEVFSVLPWLKSARKILQIYQWEKDITERSVVAIARVALSIADVEGEQSVNDAMVYQALHFRSDEVIL